MIAVSIPSTSSSNIRILYDISCEDFTDCPDDDNYTCINNKCYPLSQHGEQCDYDLQCFQRREICRNRKCECDFNYKYVYKLGRCIPSRYIDCENDSDCESNEWCSSGRCVYRDITDTSTSNAGLIIGLTVGGIVLVSLIVFVVVAVVYKKKRERALLMVAHANQSNQESVMPTTQTNPNQYNRL